jgi:hypothetical protein
MEVWPKQSSASNRRRGYRGRRPAAFVGQFILILKMQASMARGPLFGSSHSKEGDRGESPASRAINLRACIAPPRRFYSSCSRA